MCDNSSHGTIELRIQSYSAKHEQLFPANLDIEKIWEISQLQASIILGANQEVLCPRPLLSQLLFNKTASTWTRAISGASLVHHYCVKDEKDIAVQHLFHFLSPIRCDSSVLENPESATVEYTLNDGVMISMYALNLLRRIQQNDLLQSLLENFVSMLEIYSGQVNSREQISTERVCLSVLSTLLTRGTQLNSNMYIVVEANSVTLLRRFFALFYCKKLSQSVSREQIAKRLISPLLLLVAAKHHHSTVAEQLIDLTWLNCCSLANSDHEDLETCSSILCVLMSIPLLNSIERLGRPDLWCLLSKCFLSSDTVVRKRSAFIMQLIPNGDSTNHSKSVTEPDEGHQKKKEGKGKKAVKSNKGEDDSSSNPEVIPLHSHFQGPPLVLDGMSGKRAWWSDFLDVYGQIEGCTSMHLVDQIWPQLKHLCRLAALSGTDTKCDCSEVKPVAGDEFSYPSVGFVWVKSLLQILLQISIPGIRKAVFRRILLGGVGHGTADCGLELSSSRQSIRWLCTELFPLVDTVNFFSAYFLPLGVSIGCGESSTGEMLLAESKINALAHPGILMPSFLARMIRAMAAKDLATGVGESESLVQDLVRSIIHSVCGENGLHSLSAVKWILRVFAEPSLLSLIPRCLGPCELREMSAFLRGRLACSNGVVREHVLQGLLPLFLGGVDPLKVSLTDLLLTLTGNSCFGLERIVTSKESCGLLRAVVLTSCAAILKGEGVGCALSDIDDQLLAIAYTIVAVGHDGDTTGPDTDVIQFLKGLCTASLAVVAQLYRAPYLNRETQQLKALRFLSGVTRTVLIAHKQLEQLYNQPTSSSQIMRFPLLSTVQECSSDLSSYLTIAIISSLTAASAPQSSPSQPSLLIHDVALLEECSSMLGTLLLIPRLCSSPQGSSSVLGVVLRTLDGLKDLLNTAPRSSISNVLTVKSSYTLLNALQTSWPFVGIDADSVAQLIQTVSHMVSLLITIAEPSAAIFRTYVQSAGLTGGSAAGDSSDGVQSVTMDLIRITDCQFGRVSTMYLEHRWAGIRAGLELLVMVNSVPKQGASVAGMSNSAPSDDEDYRLFSLAIGQLDSCSMVSLPDILSCCLVVARRVCVDSTEVAENRRIKRAGLLIQLLDGAWQTATGGSTYTDVRAINSFVRLAFDVSILRCLDHTDVRRYYDWVESLGLKNRPHIMQCLVSALCAAWSVDATLSVPFFSLLPRLLLYREPKQDDHNVPDNTGHDRKISQSNDTGSSDAVGSIAGICRFSVLTFLETCLDDSDMESSLLPTKTISAAVEKRCILKNCLDSLITALIALNTRDDFVQAAMIGSDLYGQKLRCWQSLCVLSRYMSEAVLCSILDTFFTTLTHSAGHSIRVHVELFGAAMAIKFPAVMMPRLLLTLREFNHSQQTLCSIFVVLGHAVLDKVSATEELNTGIAVDVKTAEDIVFHLLPWMACGAGLPRTVAQLLMHSLIPAVLGSAEAQSNPNSSDRGQGYLQSIHRYLEENRDSAKGMPKQRKFFSDYNPKGHCSVLGLALIGADCTGEIVAPHILNFLADTLKAEVEVERELSRVSKMTSQLPVTAHSEAATATLQTKRVPFDELQLSLQNEVLSRQQNAAGRKRQEVVICASLIDKVTNLAGIARTCEIFAVQELVLSNLSVVQSDTFQGIAVSCDQWLPMSEVPVHCLSGYLTDMRRKGYTILGLEQTDNSRNLGVVTDLPSKCVLLLGREKEGIPVELLQEIDCCLEIPQYGVIRSLNVHVSAALAIWEITKHNKSFLANSELQST